MLELKNQELAEAWLRAKRDAQAAVFVNDDDEIVIVSRNGAVEPFASSPFSQQLDQCVVYLDDAHTRGTDVKLPSGFRAAVTLGPKVTKDRLTQGCMRMRKLGNGHSVMFFAPTEVDRSIRSATQKANTDCVDVADILYWAMRETCLDIQMRASHWAQQGSDFSTRHSAWIQFSHAPYHFDFHPGDSLVAARGAFIGGSVRTTQFFTAIPGLRSRRSKEVRGARSSNWLPKGAWMRNKKGR
ncbi:uncharacterized protein EDB91DRAFT_1229351 [Suillus paluster]|uniref:uncharacterized protein n=1 Tax=Suillus paluster TaxID=48578 RepID=UPI001B8689AF|nr:uncharacterized protein EDB91DRAFT_1229351 [Suillus paluster]KAG1725816.1 hypothetical protein EDB91DRAFT_1229351 [Suillus paluster]